MVTSYISGRGRLSLEHGVLRAPTLRGARWPWLQTKGVLTMTKMLESDLHQSRRRRAAHDGEEQAGAFRKRFQGRAQPRMETVYEPAERPHR